MTSHPGNPMGSIPNQVPYGFPNMGNMPMNPMQNPFPFNMMPINMNRGPLTPPLYVGDLDETVHDEYLHDFFSKYGPLHFVRIMRDGATGKSRGFAYVNFINPRDAETARQHAQYEKMGRKHIRIMFKRNMRDLPSNANLFVKNIDRNATIKDLDNFFTKDGTSIVCCKVATNSEGQSLGYGYVQFEKPEEAQAALQAHTGERLKENELYISVFVPKEKRPDTAARRNIYVKNLPTDQSEEQLNSYVDKIFSKYGEIETKMIKKHPTENKYSCFVCFKEEDAAHKAFDDLQKTPIETGNGETLYVNWHQSRSQRARELRAAYQQVRNDNNLFLKNLKLTTTDNDLEKAFSNFGKTSSTATKEWVKNGQPQAKQGFVAFDSPADAQKALSEALRNPEIRDLFLPNVEPFIGMHQLQESRRQYLAGLRRWKQQKQFQQPVFPPARGPFPPQQMMMPGGMSGQFRLPANRSGMRGGPGGMRGGWGNRPHGPQRGGNFGGRGGYKPQGGRPTGQHQGQSHNQAPHQGPGHVQGGQQQQQPQTQATTGGITIQSLRAKLSDFLQLDQDKQRQILGELLFPRVREHSNDSLAPKITGMLVDLTVLEVTEILDLLEDPNLLMERVSEAIELIQSEGL